MMKRVNLVIVVVLNLAFTYFGLLLVNFFVEYRYYHKEFYRKQLHAVEATARTIDASYYHQCLSTTSQQMFYPDLLAKAEFQQLSREFRFIPLGPQPHSSIAYCNEGYGFATYTSDRFGHRNIDSQWDQPIDALLVGDFSCKALA